MNKYLTVGTDKIDEDMFVAISDSNAHSMVKPSGGLWLTEFNTDYPNYNCWLDFLLHSKRNVLFYKSIGINPFKQPCCVVSLKSEANIYRLDSDDSYKYLIDNYGNGNGGFSYEKISHDYDGIFINLNSMSYEVRDKFRSFDVNSLILFNSECIDYYYSGVVDIDPFDPSEAWAIKYFDYVIKWDDKKRYVLGSKNDEGTLKR